MIKARFFIASLAVIVAAFVVAQETAPSHHYRPPEGFVPDAETAIQIAHAVWLPLYGATMIDSEKPYTATLKDGVWTVSGYLASGHFGGVALAEISKLDGTILKVSHGK